MPEGEKKEKRIRFTYEDDVVLLREVTSRNPYANGNDAWEEIQNSIFIWTKKHFTIKTIRQHIQLLLNQWKQKESSNKKSSGIEEPYSEKDTLLQEISDMMEVWKKEKEKSTKISRIKKAEVAIGKENRDVAAFNFCDNSTDMLVVDEHDYVIQHDIVENYENPPLALEETEDTGETENIKVVASTGAPRPSQTKNLTSSRKISGPIRSRAKKTNYIRSGLDYLKEKNEKELMLEEKRLEIEERKVAVRERECTLSEKRFIFESEHYKHIFESQQVILRELVDMLKNNK